MARDSAGGASTVERLGRYEVLGEIASGGMATVFLGRVTGAKGFQRLVAIKRLHPHLESEEDFVSMFLDEARLAARIRHQNVVGTLDVEDQAGLYIVMEYIEGDRLLGLLRHAAKSGERIPIPVALRIAIDTLAGLHAAHELQDDDGETLGLVHRDVSPQNILIGVDGVARLTDFGIAKATSRLTVTRDGQLKGKIAYMAPEQTKRVEIDRRVDLFAMGIIAWEMLASKKLFTGESDVEVLNQLLFEPIPRLKDSAPGIPAALDAAVMKALERDPAKRYLTASEFSDALERACKIVGGPANAKAVAAHLQKVAGDKLAKDRARITTGAGPAVTADGASPATPSRVQRRPEADAGSTDPNAARSRRATMTGLGGAPPPPPPPGARRPAPPPAAPVVTASQSLLDDDEDIPTQAVIRAKDMMARMQAKAEADAERAVLEGNDEEEQTIQGEVPAALLTAAAAPAPPLSSPHARDSGVNPLAGPMATRTTSGQLLAPSLDLPEISDEPPVRSRRGVYVGIALVMLIGGSAAAYKLTAGSSGSTTAPTAAVPVIAAPPVVTTPTVAPVAPAVAVGETPAPVPGETPPTVAPAAAVVPAVAPAPVAAAAAPTVNPVVAPAPAANTQGGSMGMAGTEPAPAAAPAHAADPEPAASAAPRGRPGRGGHRAAGGGGGSAATAGSSSGGASASSGAAPAPAAAPAPVRPAPAAARPPRDDPFGNDNPYQR